MNWKKEITSWGAILAVFAFLYFSGLLPVIQGALQSVLLATGLMKPSIEVPDLTDQKFDYRGQFTDFKGNTIDLQSYRGKTVFINLWASWCGPCRIANKHLVKIYPNYKNKNIVFLSISLDEKQADWISAVKKDKLNWTQLIDTKAWNSPVAAAWDVNSIPATFLIDQEGNVVARNLMGAALESGIDKLLK